MVKLARWSLTFVAMLLALGISLSVAAQGRPPIHVQIVLDSSGSMKDSDPSHLSSLGGMIFSDLAGPNDWVGVLSMQKGRFVRVPIAKIGEHRDRVRESIRTLPFKGPTYCTEPLEKANAGLLELRKKAPDARQFLIFLSDGACSGAERGVDSEDIRATASALARNGVKIFSIGLFENGAESSKYLTADLQTMATVTDGQLFEVEKAADLPKTFAAILGRIVGSEAVNVQLSAGSDVHVSLDGYVYDASFIATGSGKPVVLDKAAGPLGPPLELPHRARSSLQGAGFYVSAQGNGHDQHYSVLRIDEPESGRWTFRVDGPGDLSGLVIQNYALDPVVESAGKREAFALGEKAAAVGWLRGRDGKPLDDAEFLAKIDFTAFVTDPQGKERELSLALGEDGQFHSSLVLDTAGTWVIRGRARMKGGGLDKPADSSTFEVRESKLVVSPDQKPITLGKVKAGTTTGPYGCDLGASKLPAPVDVTIRLEGVEQITLGTTSATLNAESAQFSETFAIDIDHGGGPFQARLIIEGNGQSVAIPVSGEVIPLSFWEKWGALLTAVAVGVLGLLFLLFIVHGFFSPHSFRRDAVLQYGETREELNKYDAVIREQVRARRRGFRRNAELQVGGPTGFPSGFEHVGRMEATGPSQVTLSAREGVDLFRVGKFDDTKTTLVEGGSVRMQSGEIYKIGKVYLRLR